jgi:hypothetical protein
MKIKSWYFSKTIWLNAITAAIAVGVALQGQSIVADNPELAAALVAGLGVLNIGLRLITVFPIGE